MAMYGSYAVAKEANGDYSVYYKNEYVGLIEKKGAAHYTVDKTTRFDRLYLAVKYVVQMWIKNNNLEKEK